MIRLLRLAGFLGEPFANGVNAAPRPLDAPSSDNHVGVWERKIENGKTCFVRRKDAIGDWQQWANVGRIEPKGNKRRVLLIGESVTRGYLYDPLFNPAMALQMILDGYFGDGEVEVIDLARSNMSFEVRELAISALQLEPDIAIVFSGNNWWSVSFPVPPEMADFDHPHPKDGIAEAKRLCETQIANNATRVVNDVAAAYEAKGVPLVWIVPEYNLGDWRDASTNAPQLSGDLNRQWLTLREQTERALRDEDFAAAETLARRMVEIDQGTCVTGLYMLAECRLRAKDHEGARHYLEMARDALVWDTYRAVAPRPYSVTQTVLREETRKYDNQLIDSPALFSEYLDGDIPGRRLFIDYCHLTTEGIQVTMAAAASCVLRTLKGVEVSWKELAGDHIAPPPEVEAEASFLAAIHNAHWYQSYDVVRHYCSRALSYSKHVADLMLSYIDLQTRRALPMLMSESDEQIYRLGSPLIHHYLFHTNAKLLDRVLLNAMVDALAEAGIDAKDRLETLRREEHSVANGEVNLLDFYYCSSAGQPLEVSWLIEPKDRQYAEYYKAYGRESKFLFVGEKDCPVRLRLTCRLPQDNRASIFVALNGVLQAEMVVGDEWTTWDISLPGEIVREHLNEVVVSWPTPEFEGDVALERVISNMCERKFPGFYPVFGEIHSFTAAKATKPLEHKQRHAPST